MPLYDYKCAEGHEFERAVPLARFRAPQICECGAETQRIIRAPRVVSDTIEPVWGADGKLHDSMSSYRHSLSPEGNPRGERYDMLGDQDRPAFKPPEFDRKARRDAIKAGMADVKAGRVPAVVTGDFT